MQSRSTGNAAPARDAAERCIERGLARMELPLDAARRERLTELSLLLHAWAGRMNLTGLDAPEAIARELVLDALDLALHLPSFDTLADVGSGAGVPGLPIAVAFPERRVVLVESRLRRHHFQQAARRALRLENALPLRGRAEDLAPLPCDVAVARAAARPARALEWLLPWAREGGTVAIPGGRVAPRLSESQTVGRITDARVLRWRRAFDEAERSLWLARRPLAPGSRGA